MPGIMAVNSKQTWYWKGMHKNGVTSSECLLKELPWLTAHPEARILSPLSLKSHCLITPPSSIGLPSNLQYSLQVLIVGQITFIIGSSMFSSKLFSCLHPRHRRSCRARVFDANVDTESNAGPSASHSFQTDLSQNLQTLMGDTMCSSSKTDLLSLSWICQAFDVVISTQLSVKQALHCTHATPSSETHASVEKMVRHCMDDHVRMLDACNLLKETLAGAHAYVKACHHALKRLQDLRLVNQGDIQRAQHVLLSIKRYRMQQGTKATDSTKKLQACISMLKRMGDKLPTPATLHPLHVEDLKTSSSMAALYGGEICTLFSLRLLSTALSSAGSPHRSSSSMHSPSGQQVWGPALLALQARLHSEASQRIRMQKCGTTLLPEMCTLDASLHQISQALLQDISSSKQARNDVQDLVYSISLQVDHLQSSMARLLHQLDCISGAIVDIRTALLDSRVVK